MVLYMFWGIVTISATSDENIIHWSIIVINGLYCPIKMPNEFNNIMLVEMQVVCIEKICVLDLNIGSVVI